MHQIIEHPDNDMILSQVFADKIVQARKERFPSADDILNQIERRNK
jgi:hypothetical protein